MKDYIAYYRVSTDRQGASGLGLEAQRETVKSHMGDHGQLLAEYIEVESGRRHTNRPKLLGALEECRKRRATLVIAKLDRLARNVAFIANLMESGVDFIAADMPEANRLTIHILAAVAEHEREMISKRTKEALAAAKARGTILGNPRAAEMIAAAREARQIVKPAPEVKRLLASLHSQGKSLRAIARELNRLNVCSPRNKQWYAKTVKDQLAAAPGA